MTAGGSARAIIALLLALLLASLFSGPLFPQKRREVIPVPDASWQPITKPAGRSSPSDVMAVKRSASSAHQSGQNRVTALLGSGSGAASPEQVLAWGANQLVLPAGLPAGLSGNLARAAYLARASWFNGQGKPVRDILLLESRLEEPTKSVAEALLSLQHDFDLADAETLARQEEAQAGQRRSQQPRDTSSETSVEVFPVGQALYRVVVISPSDFWPENVLDLLLDYITGGGRVVFLGRQPLSIQRLLFRSGVVRVGDAPEDIERGVNYAVGRDFHVTLGDTGEPAPAILYQHRADAKRHYYFVVNADQERSVSVRLSIAVGGTIEEWDLHTGLVTPLRTPAKEIPAGGSVAIVVVR
jgi:hypothetical protein